MFVNQRNVIIENPQVEISHIFTLLYLKFSKITSFESNSTPLQLPMDFLIHSGKENRSLQVFRMCPTWVNAIKSSPA